MDAIAFEGLAGGINTYGYMNGNPVNYVDPTGEVPIPLIIIGGAIEYGIELYQNDGRNECVNW